MEFFLFVFAFDYNDLAHAFAISRLLPRMSRRKQLNPQQVQERKLADASASSLVYCDKVFVAKYASFDIAVASQSHDQQTRATSNQSLLEDREKKERNAVNSAFFSRKERIALSMSKRGDTALMNAESGARSPRLEEKKMLEEGTESDSIIPDHLSTHSHPYESNTISENNQGKHLIIVLF